jgi:hypothetical protein
MEVVRAYCERGGPGWFAEPLNAITNLAFLVAAAGALWRLRRPPLPLRRAWDVLVAAVLLVAVAAGSTIWHTLARPWAELADAIPIFVLMTFLLEATMRRVLRLPPVWRMSALLVFLAANALVAARVPPQLLHGSLFYAPGWLALGALALAAPVRAREALVTAWVLFSFSLVMRTIDLPLCQGMPVGTHFLWHVINALVLYRLTELLVRTIREPA